MQKQVEGVQDIIRIPNQDIDTKKLGAFIMGEEKNLTDDNSVFSSRLQDYLSNWDDYFSPRLTKDEKPWADASDFHIPVTMWVVRAIHAKVMEIIMGSRDWMHVVAQEKLDQKKVDQVYYLMRWAVISYVNRHKGIGTVIDDFIWNWVTIGWAVLERGWEQYWRKTLVLKDLEQERIRAIAALADTDMELSDEEMAEMEPPVRFEEVFEFEKIFDGPTVRALAPEDVVFPGRMEDVSDMNEPQIVLVYESFEEHDLNTFKDQEFWDPEVVKEILERHSYTKKSDGNKHRQRIKEKKDKDSGTYFEGRNSEATRNIDFVKAYLRTDLDKYKSGEKDYEGDGYSEEIVVLVHLQTGLVPYWNYLDRVTHTKGRMLYKADFIRRPGRPLSLGACEMLYPIQREVNAFHNMRVDNGMITNVPWGVVRATASLKPEELRVEPGVLFPVDDVHADIKMMEMRDKSNWGREEESMLLQYAERMTGINPMQLGSVPSPVGGSRTVGGGLTLLQQAATLMKPQIIRLADCLEKFFKDLYIDMIHFMPAGLEFRVLGSMGEPRINPVTGKPETITVENPDDLRANIDFKINLLSAMSSPELEEQKAMMRYQTMVNEMTMQMGIVSPLNMYNMLADVQRARGDVDIDDYITRPAMADKASDVNEEISAIVQGDMPKIVLNDNHGAKIQGLQMFFSSEAAEMGLKNKTISERAPKLMEIAIMQHMAMQQMLNQASANVQNMNPQDNQARRSSGAVETQSGKPLGEKQQAEPNPPESRGGGGQTKEEKEPQGGSL